MTETLISLISILTGIIGANTLGYILKKYSFGIIGNTIAGVFGSIFLIKSFGRFGFDPSTIVLSENMYVLLFGLNCLISFLGGAFGILFTFIIKNKLKR
jgi:hypothetical protein